MKLIVEDQEGRQTEFPFDRGELSIGREEGNKVRLDARNVSRRHARLLWSDSGVVVEDLGSFTGIRVNGEPVQGQAPVSEGDQISIGDYSLVIEEGDAAKVTAPYEAVAEAFFATDPGGRNVRTAVIDAPPGLVRAPGVIPLRPDQRPALIPLDGGEPLDVPASDVVIGREATESGLVLNHRSISRRHARLWLEPDASWHISDLNSINGLRVNGEPYREAPLRSGDEVELGHVRLRFLGPSDREAATNLPRFLRSLPHWSVIAGLVALIGLVEVLRWSGSLSRVAPYFGLQPSAPSAPAAPPRPPTGEVAAVPGPPPPAPSPEPVPAEHPPRAAPLEPKAAAIPARRPDAPTHPRTAAAARKTELAEAQGEAVAPDPARAAQAYEDAIALINSGDFQDALGKLHHALQWNPQLAEAHKAMGICFANLHQADKGAFHYEQYLKLRPQASDAAEVRRLLSDYYRTLPSGPAGPASPAPPGSGPP